MEDRNTQLRKGVLELAVLVLLADGERYGGEIVDRLAAFPSLDAGQGTVYPLLSRLRKGDVVDTSWHESPLGPPRRYYRLTGTGRVELDRQLVAWRELVGDVASLVEEGHHERGR